MLSHGVLSVAACLLVLCNCFPLSSTTCGELVMQTLPSVEATPVTISVPTNRIREAMSGRAIMATSADGGSLHSATDGSTTLATKTSEATTTPTSMPSATGTATPSDCNGFLRPGCPHFTRDVAIVVGGSWALITVTVYCYYLVSYIRNKMEMRRRRKAQNGTHWPSHAPHSALYSHDDEELQSYPPTGRPTQMPNPNDPLLPQSYQQVLANSEAQKKAQTDNHETASQALASASLIGAQDVSIINYGDNFSF